MRQSISWSTSSGSRRCRCCGRCAAAYSGFCATPACSARRKARRREPAMLGLVVLMLYAVALIVIVAALARVTPPEGDEPGVELAQRDEGRWTTRSLTLVSVAVAVLWFVAIDLRNFT